MSSYAAPLIATESERVDAWRLHTLIEAGYPVMLAEKLAQANHVDLHQAVELLRAGCNPELGAEILL
jgi:hypothetical protein